MTMEVLDLYSLKGEKTGSVTVPTEMVNYLPNPDAVYFAIKGYQRNHRQGTARVKTRGEVVATTAKPWRQKGTGRARSGMSSSPVWRGGGTVFGPTGELGAHKVNRKTRQAAVRSLLCQSISDNKMIVLESMYEAGEDRVPKTKNVAAALKALKLDGKKVLLLNDEKDDVLWKAARNIDRVSLKTVRQLNVSDMMDAEYIVTSKKSLESMKELF